LVVHIRDSAKDRENVDVTVSLKVVDALFATAKQNELDVAAALRALSDDGDILSVTVHDARRPIRIWVDTHSGAE
jgi:hypothetical protein